MKANIKLLSCARADCGYSRMNIFFPSFLVAEMKMASKKFRCILFGNVNCRCDVDFMDGKISAGH